MANNKVELSNGTVLIDISSDTITAESLEDGKTAHASNGEVVTGSLKRHNLISTTVDTISDETFMIEDGMFRLGWYPDRCGSDLNHMNSFERGIVKTDSMIGVLGSASLLGNATSADIASGKTALTQNGLVVGTASVGGVNIGTKTASGGGATSLAFSGLSAQPKMFVVQAGAQMSGTGARNVVSVMTDGTTTYGLYRYESKTNSTAYEYYSASYFSWTYSNGTLTVKASSSTNGGVFRSGTSYRLIYAY